MKNIIRAYLFEVKKIIFNKRLFMALIIGFALILLALTVVSQSLYLRQGLGEDRESTMLYYANSRDSNKLYYDLICGNGERPDGVILEPYDEIDKEYYLQEYLKFDYLVKTNTLESDYVQRVIIDSEHGFEKPVSMLIVGEVSFYLLLLIAIIFPLIIVSAEYDKGMLKNPLASPIKRRDLLLGKMLFAFSGLLIVFISVLLLGFIFNGGSNDKILMFTGTQIKAVYCTVFFTAKMISLFVLMLFVSAFSLLFAEITKKAALGAFSAIAFYLLSLGIFNVVYNALNDLRPRDVNTLRQYFPLLNIQTQQSNFANPTYWITLAVYIIATVIFAVFTWRSLKKRDVI